MSTLTPAMTGQRSRWRKSLIWASNEENSLLAAEFDDCRTTQAKPALKKWERRKSRENQVENAPSYCTTYYTIYP